MIWEHNMSSAKYQFPVAFVKAKYNDSDVEFHKNSKKNVSDDKEDGSEIRLFYEETISSEYADWDQNTNDRTCALSTELQSKTSPKIASSKSKKEGKQINKLQLERNFLKHAQHGELAHVKKCIEGGVSVNVVDSYGWTALMCASHAGKFDVVKYLMNFGADVHICDNHGKAAVDLARIAGQKHIQKFFREYSSQSAQEKKLDNRQRKVIDAKFYCDLCKAEFSESSKKAHETSTVHLLSKKTSLPGTSYYIPENNLGFKMMVKSGWDKEHGLGSEGQGQKFPVKTILKRDRTGLGTKSDDRPKVTHFNAYDTSAVKKQKVEKERRETAKTLNKRAKQKKLSKHKKWERNLRQYMNTDDF